LKERRRAYEQPFGDLTRGGSYAGRKFSFPRAFRFVAIIIAGMVVFLVIAARDESVAIIVTAFSTLLADVLYVAHERVDLSVQFLKKSSKGAV
jgi:hypothetical protein